MDIVEEFMAVAETAFTSPDTFHHTVGWRGYDDLFIRWLTSAGVPTPEAWVSPSAVKAVVARFMREFQGSASVSVDHAHTILTDTIVDIHRGHGTPGTPRDRLWLVWVVFPHPHGECTRQFIEGSGVVGNPDETWSLRMLRVDESVLRVARVLDGPVDNRVGAPAITEYEGKWCLEYTCWGNSDDVWKPLDRWMEWTSLWARESPQWTAAFRYSLAVSKTDATQMHGSNAVIIPGMVRVMQPHTTVGSRGPQFRNLWTFLNWGQQRLQLIPSEDQHRLAVAMEIYRQLMISQSASLFVVLSVMMAESLLGSDRELSRTLSQRIAWVLHPDDSAEDRWQSFRTEKLLYTLRSQIVHGRMASRDIYQAYCHLARREHGPIMSREQLTDTFLARNRKLLLEALGIERTQPLTVWADQHLMN